MFWASAVSAYSYLILQILHMQKQNKAADWITKFKWLLLFVWNIYIFKLWMSISELIFPEQNLKELFVVGFNLEGKLLM